MVTLSPVWLLTNESKKSQKWTQKHPFSEFSCNLVGPHSFWNLSSSCCTLTTWMWFPSQPISIWQSEPNNFSLVDLNINTEYTWKDHFPVNSLKPESVNWLCKFQSNQGAHWCYLYNVGLLLRFQIQPKCDLPRNKTILQMAFIDCNMSSLGTFQLIAYIIFRVLLSILHQFPVSCDIHNICVNI